MDLAFTLLWAICLRWSCAFRKNVMRRSSLPISIINDQCSIVISYSELIWKLNLNKSHPIFIILFMNSKSLLSRSTRTSLLNGNVQPSKKDSFPVYVYKRGVSFLQKLWSLSRRFLWVSSTGMIFLVLPFAFVYTSELQKEAMKTMHAFY